MLYLDTSLVVTALVNEPRTHDVQQWLKEQGNSPLLISQWTVTEVSAALSIKLRTRQITSDDRALAQELFSELAAESYGIVDVTNAHFQSAARFARQHQLSLRAGDALHLAIASSVDATLHTLDHRQAEAGPPLGVATKLLG